MNSSSDIRQRAIALVEELPDDKLLTAIRFLEQLDRPAKSRPEGKKADDREKDLLETIQRRLSSEERSRLDYLRQREENGDISESEHQELLFYVDLVECQDAERAAALLQLARLRQVDVRELLAELIPETRVN